MPGLSATWIAAARAARSDQDSTADGAGAEAHGHSEWLAIAAAALTAFNVVALAATVHEIDTYWSFSAEGDSGSNPLALALSISAFVMLYGAALLAAGFWRRSAFARWQALLLLVFTIAKTFLYDMRNLSQGYRVLSFLGLGALLMAVSFAYQKDWLALRGPAATSPTREGYPE